MFTLFFAPAPVNDFDSAKASDTRLFGRYFRLMLDRGIYLPPSQFEAAFISAAHGDREIEKTLRAHRSALGKL
jgi:glutamate-1-semialdehyde 2,1-aminomutase